MPGNGGPKPVIRGLPHQPPNKIACGLYHTVSITNVDNEGKFQDAVTEQTSVYSWGRNLHNCLGQNIYGGPSGVEKDFSHSPNLMHDNNQLVKALVYEVACGNTHTLLLVKKKDDWGGKILGIGLADGGRLGIGEITGRRRSIKTGRNAFATELVEIILKDPHASHIPRPGASTVTALRVCCGADHSLCLTNGGFVFAWGVNNEGQCGISGTYDIMEPQKIFPPYRDESTVTSIAAGARHSLMIAVAEGSEDGLLYTWGSNQQGRLGLGKGPNKHVPTIVDSMRGTSLTFVAGGEAHSGAIDSEKRVWIWGVGAGGRLGLGETLDVAAPRLLRFPDEHGVSQLALGAFHSVALTAGKARTIFSWGSGEALGLLADGDTTAVLSPKIVDWHNTYQAMMDDNDSDTKHVVQIAAGTYHTVLLLDSGNIITFGQSAGGRLGHGAKPMKSSGKPQPIRPIEGHARAHARYGFALKNVQMKKTKLIHRTEVKNDEGEVETNAQAEPWEIRQLACGDMHSAALTHRGELYMWGCSEHGQLGFGDAQTEWIPRLLGMELFQNVPVRQVSLGHEHCLAVTQSGDLWAWGKGEQGQLGIGRQQDVKKPSKVNAIKDVVYCSAGDDHSAAICSRSEVNELWTWGSANSGKLGHKECASVETAPKRIEEMTRELPQSITCSQDHTVVLCARKADNAVREGYTVWTFGGGWYGRLGHGNLENQYEPKVVEELQLPIRLVECGAYHTVAMTWEEANSQEQKDYEYCGSLFVWGRGKYVCESNDVLRPTKFRHLDSNRGAKVVLVSCGHEHTFAILTTGDVYAWGDNSNKQLGPATPATGVGAEILPMPTRLPPEIHLLATGPSHSMALLKSKETYAWGNQRSGRLGLADKTKHGFVDRPSKVKAEWASIEAITGMSAGDKKANLEDEEESASEDSDRENSKVAILPVEGSDLAAAAVPAGGEVGTYNGTGKKAKVQDQPESNKRMLQAIASGQQKVQQFATMQTLLKNEPEQMRVGALRRDELSIMSKLEEYIQAIKKLPEKETEIIKKQSDFEQSFCSNLKYIRKMPGPQYGSTTRGPISTKLGYYEELLWVLQQQANYLATQSMYLYDNPDHLDTFYETVDHIFAEMDNDRTQTLFLALLKMGIFKEIEQAKNLRDLFKGSSRVTQLIRKYALHRIHFKDVVHRFMDTKAKDASGVCSTMLASLVHNTLDDSAGKDSGLCIAFTCDTYKEAPQRRDKVDKWDNLEVDNDFKDHFETVRRFIQNDVVKAIKGFQLPCTIKKIFDYTLQEIRKRRFPDAANSSEDIDSQDQVLFTPMLYVVVMGIIVPMLRDPAKYAGDEVFLKECKTDASEESVDHNIKQLADLFEEVPKTSNSKDSAKPYLVNMAKTLKVEMLKSIMEQVTGVVDDTDTQLTVDLYVSHFDRTPHVVAMRTPTLMKLSNLLSENLSKLRLNQKDAVDSLCEHIGRWTPEQIEEAEQNQVMHNFIMNTRFLFQGETLVICNSSHCPVPARLSSAGPAGAGEKPKLIITYEGDQNMKYSHGNLEELFYKIEPLSPETTTFLQLQEEFDKLKQSCISNQPPDYALANAFGKGITAISELKNQEATPVDLLEWMAISVNERDRHRRYLRQVEKGIGTIENAMKRHLDELQKARVELGQAMEFSKFLELPDKIVVQGQKCGAKPRFDTVSRLLHGLQDFGRETAGNKAGVSYAPQMTKTLAQLKKEGVCLSVDDWLSGVERVGGTVKFTFIQSDTGLSMTVSVSRVKNGKSISNNVKQVRITEDQMRELRRKEDGSVVGLPPGDQKPLVQFEASRFMAMLHKMNVT